MNATSPLCFIFQTEDCFALPGCFSLMHSVYLLPLPCILKNLRADL